MTARLFFLLLILSASACSNQPLKPPAKEPAPPASAVSPVVKPACNCPPPEAPRELPPIQIPDAQKYAPPAMIKPDEPIKGVDYSLLKPAAWEELEGFEQDDLSAAWPAWLQSCSTLKNKQPWQSVCNAALALNSPSSEAVRTYYKQYFSAYRVTNTDGTDTGLITGYYEPLLKGSRNKTERYRYPLYAQPDDLITVELGNLYPELVNKRVRGRLIDNKLVPYYSRGEIDLAQSPLQGKELLWIDDIIDLFFLQIQGSGLIQLDNGERLHVGYADQNGQAYQSIGRLLIERGELSADKASMQGIKDWARGNPDKLRDLLNSNPSYVFFRELPAGLPGPLGALGVPILAERSVAIDPRYIPLGAPVLLSATYPNSSKPLQRLMLAQDTGGAIKGGVRADFFWGAGFEAGRQAGAMKQRGKIWVLLPKNFPLTASN